MGKLDGKVVFITGAARGQGRAHAVTCATAGADIIAVDICDQIESVAYRMSTPDDLEVTAEAVRAIGQQAVVAIADTRDVEAMSQAVKTGVEELGSIDCVIANAGILSMAGDLAKDRRCWDDSLDVNLTGTYNTVEACLPSMLEGGSGGSIVLMSSIAGTKAFIRDRHVASPGYIGYTAAKHGIIGLMRVYAMMLAADNIRVNAILPTGVNTQMCVNEYVTSFLEDNADVITMQNALPVELVEAEDTARAAAWLLSDDARYLTGVTLPVDAGCSLF
jgi:SDR family mycofactocin-dependent oxidoreductase